MTIITLTTDFGIGDHEVGVLKGVIWNIACDVKIADLSHEISPHNIFEAALLLWRAVPYFSDGTIHVAVIDPGVGTSRREIAAHIGSQFFVGPDNGLITLLLERAEESKLVIQFVHLDRPEYWLPDVSNVFHGRDIFAPVAAHLASGVPLRSLGTTITDPVRLDIPKPNSIPGGWQGQVIHIDHFGNLSTNLSESHVKYAKEVIIYINGEVINGIVGTFSEHPSGTLIALLDSSGSLAISIVNGSAAQHLKTRIGDNIKVLIHG
jgi:S-adenosylmethionine hydrolase